MLREIFSKESEENMPDMRIKSLQSECQKIESVTQNAFNSDSNTISNEIGELMQDPKAQEQENSCPSGLTVERTNDCEDVNKTITQVPWVENSRKQINYKKIKELNKLLESEKELLSIYKNDLQNDTTKGLDKGLIRTFTTYGTSIGMIVSPIALFATDMVACMAIPILGCAGVAAGIGAIVKSIHANHKNNKYLEYMANLPKKIAEQERNIQNIEQQIRFLQNNA